ncbi:MAG: alpha/beta hydrolase [Steroidobacteraceae bacterium]
MREYQPRRVPRHDSIRLRGLSTHLTCWGPAPSAGQPPLFLLHGFQDTSDTFQFLVDAFVFDAALVALDWRGFGRTDWPADGYWFPDYVADLDALLEAFSPGEPVRIVGHSMGGNVAGIYAGARPDRVRCVVNIEGLGLPRTQPSQAVGRLAQWLKQLHEQPILPSYADFEELAERIRRRYPRVPPERLRFIARSWARTEADGRVHLLGDPRHRRVNPVLYRRDEVESCWSAVRCPMLMLFGGKSGFAQALGADGSEARFRELIPGLQTRTIEGAGHMMHLECPERIAPLIQAFLEAH